MAPMSFLCRTFGHRASLGRLKRDPVTFREFSRCKRCGTPLVQGDNGRWEPDEAANSVRVPADKA
jgi:uncharacterized protein with PIN domain